MCYWVLPGWARVSPWGEQFCSQPDAVEVNILVNKLRPQGPAWRGRCPVSTRPAFISGAGSQLVEAMDSYAQQGLMCKDQLTLQPGSRAERRLSRSG